MNLTLCRVKIKKMCRSQNTKINVCLHTALVYQLPNYIFLTGPVCRHLNAGTRVQIEGFNKGKGQSVFDFKEHSDFKGQNQV